MGLSSSDIPASTAGGLVSGLMVPLYNGNATPQGKSGAPGQIVANTTMESFQQKSNGCLGCHVYAPIATAAPAGANGLRKVARAPTPAQPPYASDYSFIFLSETRR